MKIKPTGDRLLVKIVKIEEFKGILLAHTTTINGSAAIGDVIGLGEGYLSSEKNADGTQKWDLLEAKVGERIIFNARAGLALTQKIRLIRESEVLAKIGEEGTDIGDSEIIGIEE